MLIVMGLKSHMPVNENILAPKDKMRFFTHKLFTNNFMVGKTLILRAISRLTFSI